jgi:aspartate racemase
MKKIGLIGGMSWESSLVYYKIMNEKVRDIFGGFHSCNLVMESVDFALIEKLQHKNDWKSLCKLMVESAKNLERAKAEIIILCTNTMHLCISEILKHTWVPVLHIATATGNRIKTDNINKVLLVGTKFTMESKFYGEILQKNFGIEVITPHPDDRTQVHRIIYEELVHGIVKKESKKIYKEIINKSLTDGAKGVILGCTEIPILFKKEDLTIPIYDTTRIHAEAAVKWALND